MEEEVEEEYKAAATVDSRRACPSGCPRAVRGGVTATRRQAALGILIHFQYCIPTNFLSVPRGGQDPKSMQHVVNYSK